MQTPRPTPIKRPRAKFHDGAQIPPWGSIHINQLSLLHSQPPRSDPQRYYRRTTTAVNQNLQKTRRTSKTPIKKYQCLLYIYNVTHKSSSLVVTSIISSRRIIRCRPFSPLQLEFHGASHQGESRTPSECSHKRHCRPQSKSMKRNGNQSIIEVYSLDCTQSIFGSPSHGGFSHRLLYPMRVCDG